MATKTINVEMLAKMFLAGAGNIEAKKELLNELNDFRSTGWGYRNEHVAYDHGSGKRSFGIGKT